MNKTKKDWYVHLEHKLKDEFASLEVYMTEQSVRGFIKMLDETVVNYKTRGYQVT